MKKINVIGTTGSGKSTFSMRLADTIECPYIQMDQLFWKANWVESTDDEFIPKVRAAISADSWVLDGNYSRTNDIKWESADTVIWIDFSYFRTFFQLFKRTVIRILSSKELWLGTGNRESFMKSFLSKKSIFIWFFKNYNKNKLRYAELQNSPKINDVEFIRLRSPKEIDQFFNALRVSQNYCAR
jgi:adenylate kinase family enzyme